MIREIEEDDIISRNSVNNTRYLWDNTAKNRFIFNNDIIMY